MTQCALACPFASSFDCALKPEGAGRCNLICPFPPPETEFYPAATSLRAYVELTFASRLFEAMPCFCRASGRCYIASRVSELNGIGGGEFVAASIKLDVSRYLLCPGISAVWVKPERHYGVGKAPSAGVLPHSIASAKQGWIDCASCID